ncbi:TetR/AcrR family transcriptional regulator [Oricola thermophila]|uniref:TetR/AcrR family transcriptional regulator n=1 Tax=Oricola thermophila TaxID=2742145 RepID=A0A6N1VJK5_9HYPH|nr:TetR/AcrR family transcriptional regulator [Oricola thermophila]QKV19602.1 TetR/AcrR family transcriptional regulator [Oricola thermophila]
MTAAEAPAAGRKRAPSKRSLQTRARILDAAELLFAANGYEGTSMRDIAAAAQVPVALVNFHGGAKEELFATVVARRADVLSLRRTEAIAAAKARKAELDARDVLDCFIRPYLELAATGGPQWTAYARLIALVSADERWRPISERCFDPTAQAFITELARLFPAADKRKVAGAFVFSISAMLSLATSRWRIEAMAGQPSGEAPAPDGWAGFLIEFCEGGFRTALAADAP